MKVVYPFSYLLNFCLLILGPPVVFIALNLSLKSFFHLNHFIILWLSQEIIKRFKFFHFSLFALRVIMLHLWYFIMIRIIPPSPLGISNWFILHKFSTIRTALTRGFRIYKIYQCILTLGTWKFSQIRKLRLMKTTKIITKPKRVHPPVTLRVGPVIWVIICRNKK